MCDPGWRRGVWAPRRPSACPPLSSGLLSKGTRHPSLVISGHSRCGQGLGLEPGLCHASLWALSLTFTAPQFPL